MTWKHSSVGYWYINKKINKKFEDRSMYTINWSMCKELCIASLYSAILQIKDFVTNQIKDGVLDHAT